MDIGKANEILLKCFDEWSNNSSNQVKIYNNYKLMHSIWVLEVWRNLLIKLSQREKIEKWLKKSGEIIFLLHDIGRFYQNDKQKIFWNLEYDHWDKSFDILKSFWYDDKILLPIKYHNKLKISKIYQERKYQKMSTNDQIETVFLIKLIRDADKIENMIYLIYDTEHILKTMLEEKKLGYHGFTDKNLKDFQSYELINLNNIKTLWDYSLLLLSWIFDINFEESIEILRFYWFFEKIFEKMDEHIQMQDHQRQIIKTTIHSYLQKQLEN